MKAFRDSQDREWVIEVNVASLKRVRDTTGVDLTRLIDPNSDVIRKLSEDVFVLFDCVCALLKPQLDQHGLTPDQFGAALDEQSTERAAEALFEGTIDFFREDKRTLLKRAFSKVRTQAEANEKRVLNSALEAIESDEFDQAIGRAMSGNSSTNSQESSASTPDRSA